MWTALSVMVRDPERTFGAALTVAILIAVIASGLAVVNGYRAEVKKTVRPFQRAGSLLILPKGGDLVELARLDPLRRVEGLSISPVLELPCVFEAGGLSIETRVRGLDPRAYPGLNPSLRREFNRTDAVAVGYLLAQRANVTRGQAAVLRVGNRSLKAVVVGVVQLGGPEDCEVLAPIEATWELDPDSRGLASFVLLHTAKRESERYSEAAPYLAQFSVIAQANLTHAVDCLLEQVETAMVAWVTLAHIVMASAMYSLSVKLSIDKRMELGVLRAMGVNRRQMIASLLGWCSTVTAIGWAFGVSLGLVASQILSTLVSAVTGVGLDQAPSLSIQQIIMLMASSQAASLLGGLLPTLKAARRPVGELVM